MLCFDARLSDHNRADMWESGSSSAQLPAVTCLMRASHRDIVASPGANERSRSLLKNGRAIAEGRDMQTHAAFCNRHAPRYRQSRPPPWFLSSFAASSADDVESNAPWMPSLSWALCLSVTDGCIHSKP